MSKIEEELRAAFERHEAMTPATGPVRQRIDFAWVRARRRRMWRRAAGAAAVVALAGVTVPIVVSESARHAVPAVILPATTGAAALDGPVDVLLIGSDHRAGRSAQTQLADTVMLLHLTADRKQAYLVSLPRGGMLLDDGRPSMKLYETLLRGGPRLTRDAVADLTGVDVDATVVVEMAALRKVAEAVGAVTMCVKQGIPAHSGRKAIPAGCQDIGADEVGPLLQGRYRLTNGSYDRDFNNRAYLRLLAGKVMADGLELTELRALLSRAGSGLRVDGDTLALLGVAASLEKPELIGIGAKSAAGGLEGAKTEAIYPEVGPSLFAALRDDRMAEWVAAHPDHVDR
ncbi:LCP family protein [Actinoplanes sp. NPDC049802]|uniref:LCP family protein n=1 Tax=Actinoplanes sp. NPDC049802 TaxID=3154742 RepID=UPI0033E267B1